MIPLKRVQEVVRRQNWAAELASPALYPLIAHDLDDGDLYELSRGPHDDWRHVLKDTCETPGSTYWLTSRDHGGSAIFGVVPSIAGLGQIWLLQSKTFTREARKVYGHRFTHKMGRFAKDTTQLFLEFHPIVFNFIPRSQTRNIRWLSYAGYTFFCRTDIETDMLLFAQGSHCEEIARLAALWEAGLGDTLADMAAPESSIVDDSVVGIARITF